MAGRIAANRPIAPGKLVAAFLLAAVALLCAEPVVAEAAKCGGRKATVVGGPGDNVLKADKKGVQVIAAGGGNDLILTKRNRDIICGGPGDDTIYSGTGRDQVYGDAGNDFIDEGPGSGKAWGAAGNDTMIGGGGGEVFHGGDGDDRMYGEIQDDQMFGDGGNDLLIGGQGIDVLGGGPGHDWVRGDTNQDKFFGDEGIDTVSFATATPPGPLPHQDGVAVDLNAGIAMGDDSQEGPIVGFENVIGSSFNDTIVGSSQGVIVGLGGGDKCAVFVTAACDAVREGPIVYIANGDTPDPGLMVVGGSGNDISDGLDLGRDRPGRGDPGPRGPGVHPVRRSGQLPGPRGRPRLRAALGRRRQRHPQRRKRPAGHDRRQGRRRPRRRHPARRPGSGRALPRRVRV